VKRKTLETLLNLWVRTCAQNKSGGLQSIAPALWWVNDGTVPHLIIGHGVNCIQAHTCQSWSSQP